MEPDGDVVLLDPEHAGQLFVRQPLDVTQQEQGGVLAVEGGDGAPEPLLQQDRGLDSGMGRLVVVGRLGVNRPAAQQVDSRVDGGAPEVGGREPGRPGVGAPGHHAQEDGLQHVLRVSGIAGHAQGRAEHGLVVLLVQLGETGQLGRGGHLDGLADLRAGGGHVVRLTRINAPGRRLLHSRGARLAHTMGANLERFGSLPYSASCTWPYSRSSSCSSSAWSSASVGSARPGCVGFRCCWPACASWASRARPMSCHSSRRRPLPTSSRSAWPSCRPLPRPRGSDGCCSAPPC